MHGKVLDSASHKNKLLLWKVFVKWACDGWPGVYPVAGRWVMDARRPSLGGRGGGAGGWGGVTPSNADTRVITALLATATEGSQEEGVVAVSVGGCVGGAGGHVYLHHTGVNNHGNG